MISVFKLFSTRIGLIEYTVYALVEKCFNPILTSG